MAILTVGANGTFATIAQAVAASKGGDTVSVAPGTYVNDFITISHSLTLVAPQGASLVATTSPPNGKAIITEGAPGITVVIEGLDISGAKVGDGNGAAVRYEGGALTLKGVNIHDNQDGLLAGSDANGSIAILGSTFFANGTGSGDTHNIYVNRVGSLTVDGSTITGAVVGHQVKSRAANTTITNSVIGDGPGKNGGGGNASYEIDLPNGGVGLVKGNTIEKGPAAQNNSAIAFGAEGDLHAVSSLSVQGNTIVGTLNHPGATVLRNFTGVPVSLSGNALYGWKLTLDGAGEAVGNTVLTSNPIAAGLPPAAVPPVVVPPVATPPVETPPVVTPPVVTPPVVTPPVVTPPVVTPPVVTPPVERPPVVAPPVEPPPVVAPPVVAPPVVAPPVVTPPVATPPVEPPPVVTPPVITPPVERPPVVIPPVATPPEVPPIVEVPSPETPPTAGGDDGTVAVPPTPPTRPDFTPRPDIPATPPTPPPVVAQPTPPAPSRDPAPLPDIVPTLPPGRGDWQPTVPGRGTLPLPGGGRELPVLPGSERPHDLADIWRG